MSYLIINFLIFIEKKNKKLRSAFKRAQEKALKEQKEKLDEYLEEYYKLNYEDLVNIDIFCKYSIILL